MKTVVIVVVVLALAIAGIYFFGGYRSFDPTKQGEKARAAIKPGMPWNTVVTTAGNPQEVHYFLRDAPKPGRKEPGIPKLGPKVRFDPALLKQQVANNNLPDGFVFLYRFSEKVAFEVTFDNTGAVDTVNDAMTMADLLGTK